MAFTNSFHSSARGHSIKNAAKLAGCQRHNSRGYQAWDYSADKISALIGQPENLGADVRAFIDDTFAEAKERYNKNQKRADRLISESPFEHFNNNKKMDIATESILQIADKEFWEEFRTDEVIVRKGKEYTRHSFSPEVQSVMDSIFAKQLEAYEHIYESHKDEILNKVKTELALCQECVSKLGSEKALRYDKIRGKKGKEREADIKILSPEEQEEYANYTSAADTIASIEELRLIERIENGQMHIKVVNATGHYDEHSPHAHAVSVCWADGFKSGFDSRVAKSVVLNRWSLEIIQERLHAIAQEEIDKHPEIFRGRKLEEKQQGRQSYYSKEQYIRRQIEKITNQMLGLHAAQAQAEEEFVQAIELSFQEVIEDVHGTYRDAKVFLANCSDEELDEISEKGRQLEYQAAGNKKTTLAAQIEEFKSGAAAKKLTYQERQAEWADYKKGSNRFWELRKERDDEIQMEISNQYSERRRADRDVRRAKEFLSEYPFILGKTVGVVWLCVEAAKRSQCEQRIRKLKKERRKLQEKVSLYAQNSREWREALKAGRSPAEELVEETEKLIAELDREAARYLGDRPDQKAMDFVKATTDIETRDNGTKVLRFADGKSFEIHTGKNR